MKALSFLVGIIILIGCEILKVYFIMPFPGSQEGNTIEIAYFIHETIWAFRIVGFVLISYPTFTFLKTTNPWVKWPAVILLGFWVLVAYVFNFRFLAEKMFLQPETKKMVSIGENKVPVKQLVLGVTIGNDSKAYPIEIIGYHHQVLDTVGGKPVMITYCTVCRSGRVFSPEVDGKPETFRLVGMDHYNAMFEDSRTGSWWRQASGEAVAGQLKGNQLPEIPSQQMTLEVWSHNHPETKILQPDNLFLDAYKGLEKYDEGEMKGRLEGKDSVSWRDKSWVVGLQVADQPRAYDWIELNELRIINDVVGSAPLLVAMEPDSATFHAFQRTYEDKPLVFSISEDGKNLVDDMTSSLWGWNGVCVHGTFEGAQLQPIQSYQEYWHSWKTFRPQTTEYHPEK